MGSSVASPGAKRLLKCSEAAAALGICERTLRRYMRAERIRYHRLPGGHYRIPEEAIGEFWAEHDRRRPRRRHVPAQPPPERVGSVRRPAGGPGAGRRARLGEEPGEDYDLSPAALQRLRAQLR